MLNPSVFYVDSCLKTTGLKTHHILVSVVCHLVNGDILLKKSVITISMFKVKCFNNLNAYFSIHKDVNDFCKRSCKYNTKVTNKHPLESGRLFPGMNV